MVDTNTVKQKIRKDMILCKNLQSVIDVMSEL